jgi:hypothetical protein
LHDKAKQRNWHNISARKSIRICVLHVCFLNRACFLSIASWLASAMDRMESKRFREA